MGLFTVNINSAVRYSANLYLEVKTSMFKIVNALQNASKLCKLDGLHNFKVLIVHSLTKLLHALTWLGIIQ